MEKANFDDIVRNLLVFLKGQVPSLQSKHSREDLAHQIQSIVYTLRTSIIQLEGASTSDPRKTPEYQSAVQEIEGIKKTNTRLEESLFLEMNKTQKLAGELEKQASILQHRDLHIRELEEANKKLQTELEGKAKSTAEPIVDQKVVERAAAAEQAAEQAKRDKAALSDELTRLRLDLDKANHQVDELKKSMATSSGEGPTRETLEKALETAKLLFEKEREEFASEKARLLSEHSTLLAEFEQLKNQAGSSQETDRALIATLQDRIEKLQKAVQSAPAGDAVQNIQAATEARIRSLEKALAEARRQIESGITASPDQVESFTRENRELQQRIIDLEATVRRLSSARGKSLTEPGGGGTNTLRTEEILIFFDILTTLVQRLARSPENRDLRQKAEEAIGLLEKTHAIDPIPAVGGIYDEKTHKVVRSYFAPFLDDGIIINEISRGYRSGSHIIQRSVVWIAKSQFKCMECGSASRVQDNFCPKCGLELCAPDGTTKRKLAMLPTDPEIGIPLLDVLLTRRQTQAAQALLSHLAATNPDHPGLMNRRQLITQLADAGAF
ncbi:MAG TPA: hypothetical protein PLP29_11460 [Candidatus Ozemobacteraceae bacterium]|nr:hypothetical protein [Candidatus Ozemobacteraceae bacterium]